MGEKQKWNGRREAGESLKWRKQKISRRKLKRRAAASGMKSAFSAWKAKEATAVTFDVKIFIKFSSSRKHVCSAMSTSAGDLLAVSWQLLRPPGEIEAVAPHASGQCGRLAQLRVMILQ